MKSKRLLSLAMAAVMSVSALGYCASIRTPVGVVASAEVSYTGEKKVPMPQVQALATYTADQFKEIWGKGNAFIQLKTTLSDGKKLYDWEHKKLESSDKWLGNWELGGYKYSNDDGATLEDIDTKDPLKYADKVSIPFWYFNLKSFKSNGRYTYFGWTQIPLTKYDSNGNPLETYSPAQNDSTQADAIRKHSNDKVVMEQFGSELKAAFQTVVYVANTDEEIMAAIEAEKQREAEKAAKNKEASKKNDYVAGKQSKWNGWNNLYDTKTGDKVSYILPMNDQDKTSVVYIPPEGKGIYTANDVKYLFDVCGVTDVEQAFLFDINIPSRYVLREGKNMVVRLDMPTGYNTDGYNVYLYHIVNGKAKRIRKIGWRMYYVVFATNSFSPYVLVLTPKDQKRGVASTGEVLYANPPTGEGDVVPVAMLAATALCTSCLLTVRKRRELEV